MVQDIIGTALKLKSGELGTVSYLWRNPWESKPRRKIARIAYYEPWDWVIGTSAYEDELARYRNILSRGRTVMVIIMAAAGILAAVAVGFAAVFFANRGIVLPVEKLSRAAESYTKGGLHLRVKPEGPLEIRSLAVAFNGMAERLQKAIYGLEDRERKYVPFSKGRRGDSAIDDPGQAGLRKSGPGPYARLCLSGRLHAIDSRPPLPDVRKRGD